MPLHAAMGVAGAAGQRLRTLGVTSGADLEAFGKLMEVRGGIDRGQAIIGKTGMARHYAVLLEGVACFSTPHGDGGRQIYAFHYPGDFLGLHGFLFPQSVELGEVHALTGCSIGTIDRDALEQALQRHPALGRALWRAAMMEASACRQRFVLTRQPALQRVAHLLCEQLIRLGIHKGVIPINQVDVADAGGLSAVHTNRVFQELRQLGVLSKQRVIEVVNRERLQELAAFDGRYLDMGELLSRWDVRIDDRPARPRPPSRGRSPD
jgi:CRP-like cAMP-binding protein